MPTVRFGLRRCLWFLDNDNHVEFCMRVHPVAIRASADLYDPNGDPNGLRSSWMPMVFVPDTSVCGAIQKFKRVSPPNRCACILSSCKRTHRIFRYSDGRGVRLYHVVTALRRHQSGQNERRRCRRPLRQRQAYLTSPAYAGASLLEILGIDGDRASASVVSMVNNEFANNVGAPTRSRSGGRAGNP